MTLTTLEVLEDCRLVLGQVAKDPYDGDDWAERNESIADCLVNLDAKITELKQKASVLWKLTP